MYLPYIIMSVIYFIRYFGSAFLRSHLQVQKFLLFIQSMFALVLVVGSLTGYLRWDALQKKGELVSAEVIYKGKCTDGLYKEGKHRRAYKRIQMTDNNDLTIPDLTDPPSFSKSLSPCIAYRFKHPENDGLIYAKEYVPHADFDTILMYDKLQVRYQPGYLQNNFIDEYIPNTKQSTITYGMIFFIILMEGLASYCILLFMRLRFRRGE